MKIIPAGWLLDVLFIMIAPHVQQWNIQDRLNELQIIHFHVTTTDDEFNVAVMTAQIRRAF